MFRAEGSFTRVQTHPMDRLPIEPYELPIEPYEMESREGSEPDSLADGTPSVVMARRARRRRALKHETEESMVIGVLHHGPCAIDYSAHFSPLSHRSKSTLLPGDTDGVCWRCPLGSLLAWTFWITAWRRKRQLSSG